MKSLFAWASLLMLSIMAQEISPAVPEPILVTRAFSEPGLTLANRNSDEGLSAESLSRRQGSQYSSEKLMEMYAEEGKCFYYLHSSSKRKNAWEPCKKYCDTLDNANGVGCGVFGLPPSANLEEDTKSFDDEDGDKYTIGECMCECEACEIFLKMVIEGLAQLDKIICAVMTSAIMTIADVGTDLIPGGKGVKKATEALVEGAKTFSENDLNSGSLFTSWVGPACGIKDFNFDKDMIFGKLLDAPDSLGTSIGCKKKNKSACKKPEKKPDSTKKLDPPKTTDKPKDTTTKTTSTTSSTTTTTEDATATDCGSCSKKKTKLQARDGRWGRLYGRAPESCPISVDSVVDDEDVCPDLPDDVLKDEVTEVFDTLSRVLSPEDLISRDLASRAGPKLTSKTVQLDLGVPNKQAYDLDFGKYAGCGAAENDKDIQHKFIYFKEDKCNSAELQMEQVRKKIRRDQSGGQIQFQTEHVYEPQMLRDFFLWLIDGAQITGGSHIKPKKEWVDDVLINPLTSFTLKDERVGGSTNSPIKFFNALAGGFGRSDGVVRPKKVASEDFTVLDNNINNDKANWHGGIKTNTLKGKTVTEARKFIKNVGGSWAYNNFKTGREKVWDKWMRTSNWIDLVLHVFDEEYAWGSNSQLGEPERTGNSKLQPSLRALYAHWIDEHLKEIEKNASDWQKSAKKNYENAHKNEKDHREYMKNSFDGFVSLDKLKFPRPGVRENSGPSDYGAAGNEERTRDANGDRLSPYIGLPPAV